MNSPPGTIEIVTEDPAQTVTISLGVDLDARSKVIRALRIWTDPEVGDVRPGSPADEGGLKAGEAWLPSEKDTVTSELSEACIMHCFIIRTSI